MWTNRHHVSWALVGALVVSACGPSEAPQAPTSTSTPSVAATPTSTATVVPTAPPGPRTAKWVDLVVGDCIADVPAVELGEVTVSMVDCSTPHRAEVYLLAPIAVNAAIADVANQVCAAGLPTYTERPEDAFSVTYLIDSRQDRTSNNPLPSTVICLLQSSDGQPLTGTVRQ